MKRLWIGPAAALLALGACSKENTIETGDEVTVLGVGQQCSGEDDVGCGEGAVCVLGFCRHGCTNDIECPQGAICVGDREPFGCTLPTEGACSSSQPCDTGLTCGIDGQCRIPCEVTENCPRNEHTCIAGTCVGEGERGYEETWALCEEGQLGVVVAADGESELSTEVAMIGLTTDVGVPLPVGTVLVCNATAPGIDLDNPLGSCGMLDVYAGDSHQIYNLGWVAVVRQYNGLESVTCPRCLPDDVDDEPHCLRGVCAEDGADCVE